MSVTNRLVAFAQKLYNDNLNIADVRVFPATAEESMVVIHHTSGSEDKYWVLHSTPDELEWTWVRNIIVS